jgi:ribosome-associated translation inhibitor RaiA
MVYMIPVCYDPVEKGPIMQIETTTDGFELTVPIRQFVEGRISMAARGVIPGGLFMEVDARLHDINGTRGGVDKACSLVARLPGRRTIVVSAVHRDLYIAVHRAAHKLREALWRHGRRRRTLSREYAQRRLAA